MAEHWLAGRLLVSAPTMRDPNFARTIVLLLAHGHDGALGIVLNKPSETTLAEVVPSWAGYAAEPEVVFAGGPVEADGAMGIGYAPDGARPGVTPVAGPLAIVDLAHDPEDHPDLARRVRVYVGHAGWSPGQLEAEIAANGWLVVPAIPHDAYTGSPDDLWRAVLVRQQGSVAWLANCPPDPSVN